MNDENTDPVGQQIAAKIDAVLQQQQRPVVPLRQPRTQSEEAEQEERENGERKIKHDRLTVEALVTKAWQERIRQVRGDVQPEIGPRDVHIKALIMRTLMTIEADNSGFAIGEFEKLA